MPSILDLFAELGLKTDAFDGKLKSSVDQMKVADAQLNKVVASSNKLGDTSATVARRYEKLSEGLNLQNTRLKDAATAYASGDINAKKFASTLASVETQTRSLASRIADAKARVQELNETNLTHFQNQIAGAVNASDKAHSLINLNAARPLQGLGPVLQGLGARQYGLDETLLNILIVAARETGILKVAQEGTAAATVASAAAETEFAAAARTAAVAQGEVAAESELTASAVTEAAAATTLFGVGLIPLAAAAAAIAATFFAMQKAGEAIRSIGEERLKTEEAIAGALNKQNLALAEFQDRLKGEAGDRGFNKFLKDAGTFELTGARDNLQQQHDDAIKAIKDQQTYLSSIGLSGAYLKKALNEADPTLNAKGDYDPELPASKLRKSQEDQISALNARIATTTQPESSADFTKRVQGHQIELFNEAQKAQNDAAKKAAEVQQKAQKDAEEAAKKYRAELQTGYKYIAENFATLSGSNNPFVKIFSEGQKALEQMLEATKALSPALQRQFAAQINLRTQNNTFQQDLDNRVKAFDLRNDARQFRAGKRDDESDFQKNLQARLDAIGFKNVRGIVGYASGGVGIDSTGYDNGHATSGAYSPIFGDIKVPLGDNKEQRAIAERAIIAATQGIDPSKLTDDQRKLASTAREHEAARLEAEKQDAAKLVERQTKALEGIEKLIKSSSALVTIKNQSDRATVTQRPTSRDTENYYNQNQEQ